MSRIMNLLRNINYLMKHSLWDRREEDIVYLTNKILDDGIYEYGLQLRNYSIPNILDPQETLTLIETSAKSFIRTGDGEIKLMQGIDQPFQKYEKEIADQLIRILGNADENLYVGINREYFIPLYTIGNPEFKRRFSYDYRTFYARYLNKDKVYVDATFTSYQIGEERTPELDAFFARWKALFSGKNIVIVCGEGILDKLNHDVFELAASKRFIYGPRKHAWDEHERIIHDVVTTVKKDELVVFILGMAGKAMIPELTDLGYMCWDVGHLAKYYDAYMSQMEGTSENIANFYAPD